MRNKLSLCAFLLVLVAAQPSYADDPKPAANVADDSVGRFSVIEENDKFGSGEDNHYTQGLMVNYLTGAVTPQDVSSNVYNWISDSQPVIFENGAEKRKINWIPVGQSIFTPRNTNAIDPSSKDRPYGAWLYTGGSMLQETQHDTHDTLENLEILGGVVGPPALGAVTQNDFHELIGDTPARGWTNQLHTEVGVVVSYERKWRFEQSLPGNFAIDAIPESDVTLGNIFTYADVGGTIRFGQNLSADYGSTRIRPNLSGDGWFDKTQMLSPMGWYVFAGTQGRAVGRNIFLDGNSFEASPSVSKKPLVGDLLAGASIFWKNDVRVDFSVTQRSKEFYGQRGSPDEFGSIGLTIGF